MYAKESASVVFSYDVRANESLLKLLDVFFAVLHVIMAIFAVLNLLIV